LSGRKITVNGVFFDLFGTLLIYGNMEQAWSDWLSEFHSRLKQNGLTMPQKEFARCCNGFFTRKTPKKENDNLTVYELRIRNLCNDLNLSVEPKEIKRIASNSATIWQKQISLAPNATRVLKEIKQSKVVGLITNFDHPPHIYKLIEENGLEPLLDVVIISGEVELKKPDAGIFQIALEKTGLKPHEIVYIGDTEEDVTGAQAASVVPIRIQRKVPVKNGYAYDFYLDESETASNRNSDSQEPSDVCTIKSLLQLKEHLL
jgi:putative hydrolase of the HAD superfamily